MLRTRQDGLAEGRLLGCARPPHREAGRTDDGGVRGLGDREGVVVLPAHLADELAAEAVEMTAFEDFVGEKVMEGRSILGLYPPTAEGTREEFAAWRIARGR